MDPASLYAPCSVIRGRGSSPFRPLRYSPPPTLQPPRGGGHPACPSAAPRRRLPRTSSFLTTQMSARCVGKSPGRPLPSQDSEDGLTCPGPHLPPRQLPLCFWAPPRTPSSSGSMAAPFQPQSPVSRSQLCVERTLTEGVGGDLQPRMETA